MSSLNLVKKGINFLISEDLSRPTTEDSMKSPEECRSDDFTQYLATAPKGKPKAPPLIQEKVKPDQAGLSQFQGQSSTNEGQGSQIPLMKSKSASYEFRTELGTMARFHHSGLWSTSTGGSHSARSKDSERSKAGSSARSIERVKLPKGVEMKRISQDGGTVKSRLKPTPTPRNPSSHGPKLGTAPTSGSSVKLKGTVSSKKMTKTSSAYPDVKVKSFLPEPQQRIPAVSGSNINVQPHNNNNNNAVPSTSADHLKKADAKGGTMANGATLDEFLRMPETNLPEKKENKQLYKSKFWEYLNPKSGEKKKKEAKKPYDPDEVKTFMVRQREQRRLQQIRQYKEKQEEQERKQRQLKELELKYVHPKGKAQSESNILSSTRPPDETSPPKKSKLDGESPSLKYLKPLLERKQGASFLRKTEGNPEIAAKQAQYLLSEFENIVKRECISFLKQIPQPLEPPEVEKVDKAVGPSSIEEYMQKSKLLVKGLPTPVEVEKAVVKIQAAYRGYRVRSVLKNANINMKKSRRHSPRLCMPQSRPNQRRWSLPANGLPLPEKPYTAPPRMMPMSPIPIGSFNPAAVPCYIPPPSPAAQSSKAKPRVLPNIALTPVRLRVFDEPYPKLNATPTASGHSIKLSPTPSNQSANLNTIAAGFNHRLSMPPGFPLSKAIENLRIPQAGSKQASNNFDFSVPTALPSVLDAFREKLNHFKTQLQVSSPTASGGLSLRKEHKNEVPSYATDFESVSSTSQVPSLGSEGIVETPKLKRTRRSRSNSSTTVETEAEYASSSSKKERTSEDTPLSSDSLQHPPTTSNTLGDLYAPALKLQFEAEREHLKVIENALKVQLLQKSSPTSSNQPHSKPGVVYVETAKGLGVKPSESVQYAIAKVQKESLRAAAEMAKWMAEFQRSTQEHEAKAQEKKSSIDLAAIVTAAVEEAREEKRKQRTHKDRHNSSSTSTSVRDEPIGHRSRKRAVDKSVETSLTLVPEKREVELARSRSRDYQQQFPSDTEGGVVAGPVPIPPAPLNFSLGAVSSFGVPFFEPSGNDSLNSENYNKSSLEYPSIIPSGNSVEIQSLDQKVSSLQDGASLSVSDPKTELNGNKQSTEARPLTGESFKSESNCSKGELEVEHLSPGILSEEEEAPLPPVSSGSASHKLDSVEDLVESDRLKESLAEEFTESFIEDEEFEEEAPVTPDTVSRVEEIEEHVSEEISTVAKPDSIQVPEEAEISLGIVSEAAEVSEDAPESEPEVPDTGKLTQDIPVVQNEAAPLNEDILVDLSDSEIQETEMDLSSKQEKVVVLDEIIVVEEKETSKQDSEPTSRVHATPFESDGERGSAFTHGSPFEEVIEIVEEESSEASANSEEQSAQFQPKVAAEQKGQSFTEPASQHSQAEPEIEEMIPIDELSDFELSATPETEQKVPEGAEVLEPNENVPKAPESVHLQEESTFLSDDDDLEPTSDELHESVILSEPTSNIFIPKKTKDNIPAETIMPFEEESSEMFEGSKMPAEHELEVQESSPVKEDSFFDEQTSPEEITPLALNIETVLATEPKVPEERHPSPKAHLEEEAASSIVEIPADEVSEALQSMEDTTDKEEVDFQSPQPPVQVEGEQFSLDDDYTHSDSMKAAAAHDSPKLEDSPETELRNSNERRLDNNFSTDEFQRIPLSDPEVIEKQSESEDVPEEEEEVPVFTSKPQHSLIIPEEERIPPPEVPLKPPPPYSPSSSLDSTSISSRSLMICVTKPKVQRIVEEQVNQIWPNWSNSLPTSREIPSVDHLLESRVSEECTMPVNEPVAGTALESLTSAIENFDLLLWHLVHETITEVLLGSAHSTSFIEKVRPGPLALQAQALKTPKTKEALIAHVIASVVKTIPNCFFKEMDAETSGPKKSKKWCSRPRELVDEILLEELEKENYQWTEWWPEEKIVIQTATNNIIRSLVKNVLEKRKFVYSQGSKMKEDKNETG